METNDVSAVSSVEEEDKKYASEAVKFVIGHTRNGFVSLCASVATLLKEKASLEKEKYALKEEILHLRQSFRTKEDENVESNAIAQENGGLDCYAFSKLIQDVDQIKSFKYKRKDICKVYRTIKGCLCNKCIKELSLHEGVTPPLQRGDRIIIAGEICGSVMYIGHIDSYNFPEIFIGLRLDEAVGNCNGIVQDKKYFDVPHKYGLIVSLFNVCCLMD